MKFPTTNSMLNKKIVRWKFFNKYKSHGIKLNANYLRILLLLETYVRMKRRIETKTYVLFNLYIRNMKLQDSKNSTSQKQETAFKKFNKSRLTLLPHFPRYKRCSSERVIMQYNLFLQRMQFSFQSFVWSCFISFQAFNTFWIKRFQIDNQRMYIIKFIFKMVFINYCNNHIMILSCR